MAHILVVEDDVALRYTISEWLRLHAFTVIEAASADEAVTVLASPLSVDLVITDMEMPGSMDGGDLARHIAQHYPAIVVIMVSGKALHKSLAAEHISEFFLKPYNFEKLVAKIKSLLPEASSSAISAKAGTS